MPTPNVENSICNISSIFLLANGSAKEILLINGVITLMWYHIFNTTEMHSLKTKM